MTDLRKLRDEITPGPWDVVGTHPCDGWNGWEIYQHAEESYGKSIGSLDGCQNDSEKQANARAIAMVPDLIDRVLQLEAALEMAANRIDWCAGIIRNDTARDQAGIFAAEAREALRTPDAKGDG